MHGFCAPRPKGRRGRAPNGASLAARPFGETRVSNTEGLQSVEQLTSQIGFGIWDEQLTNGPQDNMVSELG